MSIFTSGHEVVTSSTKPASPSVGQLIYCTDTDEYLKYVSYGGANRWMQADLKPNRNVIINGGMSVAQRGTSTASITTGGYFTADRCYAQVVSAGTHTQSVIADAPPIGLSKSIKMLCTTAAASLAAGAQLHLDCRIEGQDVQRFAKGTTGAKSFTVSFWVKSNKTGAYVLTLEDNSNSRMTGQAYSITASGVWEYKTITYTSETSSPIADTNATGMTLLFWLAAGSSLQSGALQGWGGMTTANYAVSNVNLADTVGNYFQITGIQLEVGSAPSEFDFEPYETTLRKCQRYFERYAATDGTTYPPQNPCNIDVANRPEVILQYQRKRIAPAITVSSNTGFTFESITSSYSATASTYSGTLVGTGVQSANVFFAVTAWTAYLPCVLLISSNQYIDISAEL